MSSVISHSFSRRSGSRCMISRAFITYATEAGGLAKVARVITDNYVVGRTLYLNTGDLTHGSAEGLFTVGDAVMKVVNAVDKAIEDIGGAGIDASGGSPRIRGNLLEDNSGDGVALSGATVDIADNVVRSNGGSGLSTAGGSGAGSVTGNRVDSAKAIELARSFPGMEGLDLAREVTAPEPYDWQEGTWDLDSAAFRTSDGERHVVAYDFGVKRNILRMLADRGCRLTVVPAQTPASEVLAMQPDGVFLSNGPGDPEPCDYAIGAIREILAAGLPARMARSTSRLFKGRPPRYRSRVSCNTRRSSRSICSSLSCSASSASSGGTPSAAGEALQRLPARVPAFWICTPPTSREVTV